MSRRDARSRSLRRRPSRTVPATITALLLLGLGGLAAVVATSRLINGGWPIQVTGPAGAVTDLTWGAPATLTAAGVTALLGLVLLVAGLKPGAPTAAQLRSDTPARNAAEQTDFVISARALAHLAAARADRVDGVDTVSASASPRRVHLQVATTSEQTGAIADRIRSEVTSAFAAAGVQPPPRVTTSVRTKGI